LWGITTLGISSREWDYLRRPIAKVLNTHDFVKENSSYFHMKQEITAMEKSKGLELEMAVAAMKT